MTNRRTSEMGRRGFLSTAGSLAATPLLVGTGPQASAQETAQGTGVNSTASKLSGRRKLGLLEVSSLGLGVQNMHRTYQTTIPSRPEMINIIRTAHERGVTFFDTAEAYGPHECERILGEAIAPFRDKVVVTSKFGWNIDLETGERRPGLNSRPERIKLAVEGMLKRLRTDRIDLLYQHRVDPEVPIEDVAGAVKDLMDQGKILHWGLSEMGLDTLRRAHAALPVTAVQNEYSMLWRGPEDQVIPVCEELGIGFVPWSPLGVGFLTGAIDERTRFAEGDIRGIETRFSPENLPANLTLVKLLGDWADRKQATAAQIALAWVMAQKPWIVPIPGTTQMPHMLENIGAASISFTPEEIDELNSAVAAIKVRGQRLPDAVLAFSNVEAPEKK
ncbi:aldo/keto reductase [Sinorhizobium meliloti]|uniref:aldo/keto reductase n=1 Tax=Rhizobium meliloti TaxID=382 RepID=UPI000C9A1704|nr:aldo/keto reductase [Sinorhizobium meliloti]MDW9984091.1 aldo/keto reductase [Sinorhizobium meliloti]MDX0197067.1 aldo/keto reductase [Sinorhizobium meliloti]MDX0258702.1 aldo/keto reductase [Sinorhizobium meliloti]MDX0271682.1 aldo/keto reductase [Sinorhizobium meliloti]RVI64849.1 aldo/keto reductase [Sinorhizobium meliloti]